MDFDLISMKQRAKALMRGTRPSPWIAGVIFGMIAVFYVAAFYAIMVMMDPESVMWAVYLVIAEIIYLNFRTSCHWYCLKAAREETTVMSDVFLAFKEKQLKALAVGILKDICICAGALFCCVGWVLPVYWFRFATYVVKDYEGIGVFGALRTSMKLMKGHYVDLIKLDLSNWGWFTLTFFTSGLACFYVKPYTTLVYAEFYDYLKGQAELFGK